jgi:glucose-1-phosphate thymidylyltransferase
MNQERVNKDIIGLIPAAGMATRIAPLPCSKELYPVGFWQPEENKGTRPKVVSHYLLDKMKRAGVTRAFIILRNGKWDVPAYFGDGALAEMNLAYLLMRLPYGPPYTLDQAYPFVKHALIVFGFPDILFQPDDVFVKLLAHQTSTNADIVLGLFPAYEPQNMDMVDVDEGGRIRHMLIKPPQTDLSYGWICAVWSPVFTEFMHRYLAGELEKVGIVAKSTEMELSVGAVIQAAVRKGLRVDGVSFPLGSYLDIGTPEGLINATKTVTTF